MRCPYCASMEDKVVETRTNEEGDAIRRRRECLDCNSRFTSYEKIELEPLMVIKRGGSRQLFDLRKIERGIWTALENRPVSKQTVETMLESIQDEAERISRLSREIPSDAIGEMVLKHLYKTDKVAYIRFASVYRKFNEVEEFIKEIENLTAR